MQISKYNTIIIPILFSLLTIINYIFVPRLIIVQIFSMIFIVLIKRKFSSNGIRQIYFLFLLFSVIGYSMKFQIAERYNVYFSYIIILLYFSVVIKNYISIKTKIISKDLLKNKYITFFFIFILYSSLSLIFVKNLRLGVSIYITYIIMFSSIFIVYRENKTLKNIEETFKFLLYLYSGVLFLGTLEVFGVRYGIITNYVEMGIQLNTNSYFSRIPIVFFYNQNNYAVFLVLGMAALFVFCLSSEKKLTKILYYALLIVSQINLIFTTSRTCWISVFIIFLIGFIIGIYFKNKVIVKHSIKFSFIVIVIFLIFSALPVSSIYYGKFNSTHFLELLHISNGSVNQSGYNNSMVQLGEEGSTNIRYTILYDIAQGVFKEKHLLGFGVGNTMNYIKSLKNTHGFSNAHSMWFEVLGDFGVVILVYYVFIYMKMIFETVNACKNMPIVCGKYCLVIAELLSVFIFLAFAPSTVTGYSPFWILMGLSSAITTSLSENRNGGAV